MVVFYCTTPLDVHCRYQSLGQVKKLKRFHPDGIAAAVAKRAQDKEEEEEVKKIETDALRNSQIQVEGMLLP